MTLKTYQAHTMAEALAAVKRDLGRDAVIVHTRNVRRGGLLRFWRRCMWEITASPNLNVPPRLGPGEYLSSPAGQQGGKDAEAAEQGGSAAVALEDPPADAGADASERPAWRSEGALGDRLEGLERMMRELLDRPGKAADAEGPVPAPLRPLKEHLVEQDVSSDAAEDILREVGMGLTGEQLADADAVRARLAETLAGRIHVAPGEPPDARRADGRAPTGRPRVIALIGPTGVGKTTTIAKLAASHRLSGGRKVALITIDTYRIAAVDQLRTYADIIEVPLRAVLSAGELHSALDAFSDRDVVLIDTAGRSQNNRLRLSQLRGFLRAARPDETHLVVSATNSRPCTRRIIEQFWPLGANRLIVSKLDEAATFGVFVNATSTEHPLSYVTTGQDVPDDITRADPAALAECILAGELGGPRHVD